MKKIVALVEGDGDIKSVSLLLKRILVQQSLSNWMPGLPRVVHSVQNLIKNVDRTISCISKDKDCHALLVLLDLDDGCPKQVATSLSGIIRSYNLPFPVAIVLAHREYESWFLASLPSIANKFPNLFNPGNAYAAHPAPETKRDAKGWLTSQMNRKKYIETLHQEQFTMHFDMQAASFGCRSFQRLMHAIHELTHAPTVRGFVTP